MRDTQKGLDSKEETEVEAAWAAEIERRIVEVEQSEVETASWDEARARLRTNLATLVTRAQ